MKTSIKKWTLRLVITCVFVGAILLGIILNPALTYAEKTTYKSYTVMHNQELDNLFQSCLDNATQLLSKSELYDPALNLQICLNDGSVYPVIMEKLRGQAFAWGFYNKVVIESKVDFKNNYAELNGYKWNLTQLLVHEVTHCLQFNKYGILHSYPVAKIAEWKWEGYPEYVARQYADQVDLTKNIKRLIATEHTDNNGWIQFDDSTGTVISYYKYWLLIQYCIHVKKMTYQQILADTTQEEFIKNQMMNWYLAKAK